MARHITLTTPEWGVTDGMELSFRAPCDCSDVTGISLAGNIYDIVDASGNTLTSCSRYFTKDAILTVVIDTSKHTATLLNPRVNTYTKSLGTSEDNPSSNGTTVWARVKQLEHDLATKTPNDHTHTKADITDFEHNHDGRYYTEGEIDAKLGGKSNIGHSHVKSDIADFDHNHNDIYYTKTEVNNQLSDRLATKTDTGHTHSVSDIRDFEHRHDDLYYTEGEINEKLRGKSDVGHSHSKSDITDFDHNHDDRYYTESEINTKLNGKSNTGHLHFKEEISNFPTNVSEFTNDAGYLTADDEVGTPILDGNDNQITSLKFSLSGTTLKIITTA